MQPQRPPNLAELPLPPGWQEFTESSSPQTFRHLQRREKSPEQPALNVVMDAGNHNRVGWIHPWAEPPGLYRHGVKVLDIPFNMDSLYRLWPEMLRNPALLEEWLEEQVDAWCQRERERQGLPPQESE